MGTFRSIDELIRMLSREKVLLKDMFQNRKKLSYRHDTAKELVDYKESRIAFLIEHGVVHDSGEFLELEDVYLRFFEEVLDVNEDINVAGVKESIGSLDAAIEYYKTETSPQRKYGYLKDVRRILRNIALTTFRNVIDLKRNIDSTYKNEPNYRVKKLKLSNLDGKRMAVAELIKQTERYLSENQQGFFATAMDVGLKKTVSDVRLQRVSREMGDICGFGSDVDKIIREINYDFKEKNFVGAIRSIEIRSTDSADRMVQLLLKIKEFTDENSFSLGGLNLFSDEKGRDSVNREAVGYLSDFMASLNEFQSRTCLTLSDTFQLQFRVVENDNDTGWVEKIANVGSDGTDILVKAMVNIMLINVFKEKVSRKFGEFRIHCMMDEIGKLHPNNVKGILDFANSRNILLINSSPTTYNVSVYKYTYLLSKDKNAKTIVYPLISKREAAISRTNDSQGASVE